MAKIYVLPFLILCAATFLTTCTFEENEAAEGAAGKFEPYDNFTFQRTYPDKEFDWAGWQTTLSRLQTSTNAESRGPNGCAGNVTPWTLQGPANVAGRANTVAVKPDDSNTALAGFAGGGIFKTTDGGTTWRAVFDDHPNLAIGDITYDPSNYNVVYAGTGDPNIPTVVFNGNGLFKSTDGGETWFSIGLTQVGVMSKVVVHPTNPQILLVASMGNPLVRNGERGIYKTIDGGQTWQHTLFVTNQAGASDLQMSMVNPSIVYASFWDRIRSNEESIAYGNGARVYKSSDGGTTWTQLTTGLPTGTNSRTGLALSATDPNKLYVLFVDTLFRPGGLFKTVDGGTTFTPMNINAIMDAGGDFNWYFGKIRLNPANDEDLYFLAILLYRKMPNSNAWLVAAGGHADSHDLAFAPSGRRYWTNDGGVYRNEPNSNAWTKSKNLPTTQLYHTSYNPHFPDTYYVGAQDNGIQKGNAAGINNWVSIFPADGFRCAFHPTDPNMFWIEIQNGAIHTTLDGGQTWQQRPEALGTTDRTNWDTPYFISKFPPYTLYGGTYRVYASPDGAGWGIISGDLTDGIIFGPRFHTMACINESPILAQKLYAGTSDGNVWRREPTGSWVNITGNLPTRYVTSVAGSPTSVNRLFVSHSGFRYDEYIPHIHRSDNNGATWIDISGDLPPVPVSDLLVLPDQNDQVIFAGTDAGVYFTKDGGTHWERLGSGIPFVPVFDLEQNVARKQLVAATFGRGVYTFPLDSIFAQQSGSVVSLRGKVQTETGSEVSFVRVSGAGTPVTTAANGDFAFGNVGGCQSYTLTPTRTDNFINGVSTFDLVLLSKHILGIEALNSPYKMIAADANKSNTLTTYDIVQLRKVVLGVDTAVAGNTSWRFVPSNFTFPNPTNPFQTVFPEARAVDVQMSSLANLNFTAIKIGDLNANVVPGFNGNLPVDRTEAIWPVTVQNIDCWRSAPVQAVFSANLQAISGAQFSVQFDPDQLVFEKIEPLLPGLTADNFGVNRQRTGVLTVSFENKALLQTSHSSFQNDEQRLFVVHFRARTNGSLEQMLRLADAPTTACAYAVNGVPKLPVLTFATGVVADAITAPRVWPNPFGAAGVWLEMPDRDAGKDIQVFDTQGKVVFSQPNVLASTLFLPGDIFPAAGVYFCRIGDRVVRLVRL